MGGLFNLDNPFFTALGKLVDVVAISLLWLLLCIPVVTIGPASAALYYVVVKVIRRERGYLTREFFKSFKMNFKTGAGAGLIVTFMAIVLYFDRYFVSRYMEGTTGFVMMAIFNAMMVIILISSLYLFPVLSRFNVGIKQLFKTSIFLAVKHFPSTIAMAAIFAVMVLGVYFIPIFILIAPALYNLLSSLLLERVFKKYMPEKSENAQESGVDEWYLE